MYFTSLIVGKSRNEQLTGLELLMSDKRGEMTPFPMTISLNVGPSPNICQ